MQRKLRIRVGSVWWAIAFTPALALGAQAGPTLPYRPLLDPIELHGWWCILLLPMALGVSLAYKAVRLPTLERFWRQVLLMSAQIVVAMIVLAAASYILVLVYVKFIAERAG